MVRQLMRRRQKVLLKDLTRSTHPQPPPSGLDCSVRNETNTSASELDNNSGDITCVLKGRNCSLRIQVKQNIAADGTYVDATVLSSIERCEFEES